jgi:hypothetical protein
MRQCYIIAEEATTMKKIMLKFVSSNSAFSYFLENFRSKNCHNSVLVRANLTISTAMGS